MSKDKVFFKIVIPNYNNMAYIKQCLDSILEQTFQDFKIILVDDISTDMSYEFAKMYERRFPNKLVVLQAHEKKYAGGCRNIGIDYDLDCEYVWFVDSDDQLYDKKVLDNIFKMIKSYNDPDLVRCSYIEKLKDKKIKIQYKHDFNQVLHDGAGPFKNIVKSRFKCKFVPNRARNNDVIWFLHILDSINKNSIAYVDTPCYIYNRISITSCQNKKSNTIKKQCTDADRQLVNDLNSLNFQNQYCIDRKNRILAKYVNKYKNEISLDDLFKHSLSLTIDDIRFNDMQQIFNKKGLNFRLTKFNGNTDPILTGPENCKLSHIKMVEYAKKHNWPFVMIFEDDAYPRDDISTTLLNYINAIPYDANLVVLGWSNYLQYPPQTFNNCFNRITTPTISGSHSYILFDTGYDAFLNYHYTNVAKSADNTVFFKIQPSYIIDIPLFIQYTKTKSMNGHVGFAFHGNRKDPPLGFS